MACIWSSLGILGAIRCLTWLLLVVVPTPYGYEELNQITKASFRETEIPLTVKIVTKSDQEVRRGQQNLHHTYMRQKEATVAHKNISELIQH